MAKEWRNDLRPQGTPTFDIPLVTAEDVISERDGMTLKVVHVVSVYGQGFMSRIDGGNWKQDGNTICFKNRKAEEEAYQSVMVDGQKLLEDLEKDPEDLEETA